MNTNTKNWSFTWETNVTQKTLPNEYKLKKFFDRETETCYFQLECGKLKSKFHYQGTFTLVGPRQSKKQLLGLFKEAFDNVSGLTISKTFSIEASMKYSTKEETRVKGPFVCGSKQQYDEEYALAELTAWQQDLYKYLLLNEGNKIFRDRKILWIEDHIGNTGKSFFQKWLRVGQIKLVSRKLPVSSTERLTSAVAKLLPTQKVDIVTINLTRTRGEDQSMNDLFAAIEDIKDGYIVDTMYGKYCEAIFKPPIVLIFTNEKMSDYKNKLSEDRWMNLFINSDKNIEFHERNEDGTVTPTLISDLLGN